MDDLWQIWKASLSFLDERTGFLIPLSGGNPEESTSSVGSIFVRDFGKYCQGERGQIVFWSHVYRWRKELHTQKSSQFLGLTWVGRAVGTKSESVRYNRWSGDPNEWKGMDSGNTKSLQAFCFPTPQFLFTRVLKNKITNFPVSAANMWNGHWGLDPDLLVDN